LPENPGNRQAAPPATRPDGARGPARRQPSAADRETGRAGHVRIHSPFSSQTTRVSFPHASLGARHPHLPNGGSPPMSKSPFGIESPMSRRRFLGVTGAVSLSAALAACSNSSGGSGGSGSAGGAAVSQADIDKAMATPTTLTFWTWVPNIQSEVALFEAKYPAIKVNVVNAGQGTPQYTKLRTALQAGSGAPDLCQIEYQYVPTFTITESLLDLRPHGASALKSKFVDWTWSQVSGPNGEVFAIPQDTGPMGMLYRKDIFDKYGIAVPKTWDDFAAAARKLHAADPNVYLTNFAANQAAAWHGLLWQANAKPYTVTG